MQWREDGRLCRLYVVFGLRRRSGLRSQQIERASLVCKNSKARRRHDKGILRRFRRRLGHRINKNMAEKKYLYSATLVRDTEKDGLDITILLAEFESYFIADRAFKKHCDEKWKEQGFRLHMTNFVDRDKIEAGEILCIA